MPDTGNHDEVVIVLKCHGAIGRLARRARSGLSPEATRDALLLVLTATSGYVDAVSYLGLGHVFTSNMTGNTVLLGLALGQERGPAVLRSVIALAGFVAGVAVGAALVEQDEGHGIWPARVTAACALEGVVLLAFALGGFLAGAAPDACVVYALIALSAIAMGVQSAAVRALGVSGVTTTYITGTWTSMVSGLVTRLRAQRPAGRRSGHPPSPSRGVGLQAAVVGVYVLTAIAGAATETAWRLAAALLPAVAVGLVVVVAVLRWRQTETT